MSVEAFFDTNILLYAYDLDAGSKRSIALDLVQMAHGKPRNHALSVQVLQEFHVNFLKAGGGHGDAAELLEDFAKWRVIENSLPVHRLGLAIQERYRISFWDALIIAAAQTARAPILYSEDLNHGQDFAGVRVVNPFAGQK